jgi:ubiquinone/menaquinone biosynthesis C-methylase UbiE
MTTNKETEMSDSTAYFESVASSWDEIRRGLFPDELREKALAAAPLRPGAVAADLGAGTGFLSEGLLERGLRVIAVDQSPAMLAELESRLGSRGDLETRVGEAEALPIADEAVDFVFANMFLHHVEDPAGAIHEMARILAPEGTLVLTDLDAHEHEFLRTEQHDVWLGFERSAVLGWLEAAGFEKASVRDTRDSCCSSSCCGGERAEISVFVATGTKPAEPATADGGGRDEALRQAVRRRYAEAARQASSGARAGCGCGCSSEEAEIASAVSRDLYDDATDEVPRSALHASLGCANPVALADLRPGETVLDLGSGGGIDVILSARRVGPEGKVYGLDMTDEMLALARRNVEEAGLGNVELLRGLIEEIPLPGETVDVVLSNCVINLTPDKPRALAEAFRVLRPGGRFAVADLVATRPVPDAVRRQVEMWSACVGGALTVDDYRYALAAAGFEDVDVEVVRTYDPADFGPAGEQAVAAAGLTPEEAKGLIASALVRARKGA